MGYVDFTCAVLSQSACLSRYGIVSKWLIEIPSLLDSLNTVVFCD